MSLLQSDEFSSTHAGGTGHQGVPEEWIVQHVKKFPMFSGLPPSRIVAAILRLHDTSQIYTVTAKTYTCTT